MSVHSNSLVDPFKSSGTDRLGNAVIATVTEIWQSAVLSRFHRTVRSWQGTEAA
jgi:hypothetical protein